MNNPSDTDKTTLYYREGSSDKIYQAAIEAAGNGFLVTFAYGRRGSTLQTGTKTAKPVEYAAAKKIYDKLVFEKTAKGYSPGEEGTPYQHTDKEQRATGVLPQLLNPIDESEVEKYLADDRWWMQEKFDGRRILIRKDGNTVTAINRTGLTVGLPQTIADTVLRVDSKSCLLDGEAVGEAYYAFDLLERNGLDLRKSPYDVRHPDLIDVLDPVESVYLRPAMTAIGENSKRSMYDRARVEKREGVVFKDRSAPYTHGRPASGGSQLKVKFYATASCIVAAVNQGKRSVKLDLVSDQARVSVGSVTVPANQKIPAAGDIVEVRYLYAYEGGSLYQPTLLGVRDDVAAEGCVMRQLKFKSGEQEI
jgi:bifunctional non-homologous end joining protein LigD